MEDFIDNEYHQSTFNKLQGDIINQVMLKVKSTEVKGNYDKLIRHRRWDNIFKKRTTFPRFINWAIN